MPRLQSGHTHYATLHCSALTQVLELTFLVVTICRCTSSVHLPLAGGHHTSRAMHSVLRTVWCACHQQQQHTTITTTTTTTTRATAHTTHTDATTPSTATAVNQHKSPPPTGKRNNSTTWKKKKLTTGDTRLLTTTCYNTTTDRLDIDLWTYSIRLTSAITY